MRRALKLSAVVLLAAFATLAVVAQSGIAAIRGVVTDASGAALPGVTVTLSRPNANDRTAVTDVRGEFVFVGVEPGQYQLTSVLTGFSTAQITTVVSAGRISNVSLQMNVGTVAETVAVAGVDAQISRARRKSIARALNTEAYDHFDDNQWVDTSRRPLSTLSIDVDTASYSNVRRFLNQGEQPPKDAVRIEELINYFSYSYPEPGDGKPFRVTTAIGECPWNGRHRLALIALQARRLDSSSTPPRNLVFLIDTSGSMSDPDKLPLVKSSLAMLVRNLTATDRVAIVAYAGQAGLVLPATSGADTETILEAIARLQDGGSTNGAEGIVLAYEIARQQFVKDGVNRVVLATDGDFNVGVTNEGDLVRLIEQQRESGVALSVLGFGMGNLKDSTMEKLADKGNGNYAYIDSLQEAQKVLVEQAGGTLVTVAKDVKLQIEFNPRVVGSYRLIGYEKRILEEQDFNNDRKDAGDMGAGHSVTVLFEIAPVGERVDATDIDPLKYQRKNRLSAAADSDETMTVKVRYKQPHAFRSTLSSIVVKNTTEVSPELGFASAVAEFGMLLRDSEYKGSSTFADVRERASRFKGNDPFGHRAEFIRLIDAAEGVNRVSRR